MFKKKSLLFLNLFCSAVDSISRDKYLRSWRERQRHVLGLLAILQMLRSFQILMSGVFDFVGRHYSSFLYHSIFFSFPVKGTKMPGILANSFDNLSVKLNEKETLAAYCNQIKSSDNTHFRIVKGFLSCELLSEV